ncbi:microtubule-associated serine/threonine-protein kinase 2 isoform X2 [Zeugodacus cucurbitae]|uniref:microtubule-associated serine/threonine-protein kinase 2 isoform X2 n=1 Tax=Zeugodacus cucurbitae TaxID=28588 RepID=UPI0023D8EE22|nr:microtubule-associated serine/threonine-protein kinase 2 isoform X2 [Zeugodacus cucurbitae]
MVIDIKMCRFDNVPWGFRLVGGADFQFPLTVVKVSEGSIAEEAGLREGDVIVRINDTATSPLAHDEADKVIRHCGNVFYIGVQREGEEELVSKMFPIYGGEGSATPQTFGDVSGRKSPIPRQLEDAAEPQTDILPELPERPSSVLSEQTEIKLVEEEIAAVLSGESEVLKEHDVLGLFPKPGVCMTSDVLRTLNEDATKTRAEKDKENKKWSTFLVKPDRPIPKSKEQIEAERRAANAYKVKIVKSAPRSRSVSPMPRPIEPPTEPVEQKLVIESKQPSPPKVEEVEEPPPTDSELPNLEDVKIIVEPPAEDEESQQVETVDKPTLTSDNQVENEEEGQSNNMELSTPNETAVILEEKSEESAPTNEVATKQEASTEPNQSIPQREKTEEELALERQLADVQRQLAALSSLPSTIQSTLDAVTKQLATLLPAFQLQTASQPQFVPAPTTSETRSINLEKIDEGAEVIKADDAPELDPNCSQDGSGITENIAVVTEEVKESVETDAPALDAVKIQEAKQNKEDMQQMEEEQNVKKQKRNEVIEELEEQLERKTNPRRSKRAFGPLTPSSERPLVLPGGRRWYRPKDAYNDEFIAETLSAQAELITGTTLGCTFESPLLGYDPRVNFMKYQKPEKKIDLNRSEVYKVIHHLDRQPVRGIEVRPPMVPAEVDIRKVALQP